MGIEITVATMIIVVVLFAALVGVLSRYRKCPPDKVLVIYGKVRNDTSGQMRSVKCTHSDAAFIIPIIQAYQYMDLTPISVNVDLRNALSKWNIRVDMPSRFTVGISTEPGIMQNAVEQLLGPKLVEIQELTKDVIFGQLCLIIATMDIEETNTDRDRPLPVVSNNIEVELKEIGLRLINANVTDINDEFGYIDALDKEVVAKAINDAKKSVAEKNRDGEIGHANALKDQRIQVAAADATVIQGENDAKIEVAQSDANRREREAGALRQATTVEKVRAAMALQEAYGAQRRVEQQRAELVQASQQADIVVKAEVDEQQKEIVAEVEAEVTRRKARGEADVIYARMEAQARDVEEILTKQAAGMQQLVSAAGGDPNTAVKFIIADKLEQLIRLQVDTIKNIKIDKVTVWDSIGGENGSPTTANFLSGMLKSIPPMNELFQQAGMTLPNFLGTDFTPAGEAAPVAPEEKQGEMTTTPSQQRMLKYGRGSRAPAYCMKPSYRGHKLRWEGFLRADKDATRPGGICVAHAGSACRECNTRAVKRSAHRWNQKVTCCMIAAVNIKETVGFLPRQGYRQEARRSGCGISLHASASSLAARRLKQGE